MGIAVCQAAITEANRERYQALYDRTNKKPTAMKRGRMHVMDMIVERQGRSVRGRIGNLLASIPSTIDLFAESVHTTMYPTQTSVGRMILFYLTNHRLMQLFKNCIHRGIFVWSTIPNSMSQLLTFGIAIIFRI